MGNIYLDKEDVKAIAVQRDYDIPEKTIKQKILEMGSFLLAVVFMLISGIAVATKPEGIDTPMWANYTFLLGFITLAVFGYIKYRNNELWRKAEREFIEHWERTGEIKPRWPSRLKKNHGDYNPPRQENYTSPHKPA